MSFESMLRSLFALEAADRPKLVADALAQPETSWVLTTCIVEGIYRSTDPSCRFTSSIHQPLHASEPPPLRHMNRPGRHCPRTQQKVWDDRILGKRLASTRGMHAATMLRR
nr:hypothetical protein CFP56_03960 [Quercus suber]